MGIVFMTISNLIFSVTLYTLPIITGTNLPIFILSYFFASVLTIGSLINIRWYKAEKWYERLYYRDSEINSRLVPSTEKIFFNLKFLTYKQLKNYCKIIQMIESGGK